MLVFVLFFVHVGEVLCQGFCVSTNFLSPTKPCVFLVFSFVLVFLSFSVLGKRLIWCILFCLHFKFLDISCEDLELSIVGQSILFCFLFFFA